MSRDDEAGAVAAATYFLTELYTYTLTSQDTTAWLAMSHEECIYCGGVATAVEAERAASVVTVPGILVVRGATAETLNSLTLGVQVEVSVGKATQWSHAGEQIRELPAEAATMGAIVVWHQDRWIVRGVDVLATESSV